MRELVPFLISFCTGFVYAASKGLAVGGMAAIMELRYPGIVINATMLTMGTAFSLFAAFQARLIVVSGRCPPSQPAVTFPTVTLYSHNPGNRICDFNYFTDAGQRQLPERRDDGNWRSEPG